MFMGRVFRSKVRASVSVFSTEYTHLIIYLSIIYLIYTIASSTTQACGKTSVKNIFINSVHGSNTLRSLHGIITMFKITDFKNFFGYNLVKIRNNYEEKLRPATNENSLWYTEK